MRYVPHVDPRSLDLRAWARWVAEGRPLHFSLFGNSVAGREAFMPRHKRHHGGSVLWRDTGGERTAYLMQIDTRIHGGLSEPEQRLLLACVVPSPTGQPLPLVERAAAVGVSPDALRLVRRRALELIR